MMAVEMTKPLFHTVSVAMLLFCFAELDARSTRADDACALHGEPVLGAGIGIYDAPSGGNEIAHFTGTKVELSVTSLAAGAAGRAAVETTGFRVKGFVEARSLPVFAAHSLPVYAGHVWIAAARRVKIIGGAGGKVHIEKSVTTPLVGVFQSWTTCDALTLTEGTPAGWSPSGSARGFVLKKDHLDLFSEPRGETVASLDRASDGPGVLFWSDDRSGGWVHVEHHGEVVLDGWARAQDLSRLPPGETMDQLGPTTFQAGAPMLRVQGKTKEIRTTSAVTLRAAGSDAAAVIGGIDPGTDILVLDVVAGWASVLPKGLGIAPAGNAQFWARAKDLGL